MAAPAHSKRTPWLTRGVIGIVAATFFSDVGHEMVTAVLPLYLGTIGLGPAALGAMEGFADFVFSVSKLAGGVLGHKVRRKRPWGTLGYAMTALFSGLMALAQSLLSLVTLRGLAWFGRGLRSPLRDFMLADEVGATHFGRAYGVERAADMIGAVCGPLVALGLVALDFDLQTIIFLSVIPASISVLSFYSLTRDRVVEPVPATAPAPKPRIPRAFWWFVGGVLLFGLGDFSRTFLIFLAAQTFGETVSTAGALSLAVLLYAGHNLISAVAAFPAGHLGDRYSKTPILIVGYALGVGTNVLLAIGGATPALLVTAVAISGIYIAIEETIEKATAATLLPREVRSLGLGVLATANAVGDMASSLWVGAMLATGHSTLAFAAPAAAGALGVVWMIVWRLRFRDLA